MPVAKLLEAQMVSFREQDASSVSFCNAFTFLKISALVCAALSEANTCVET